MDTEALEVTRRVRVEMARTGITRKELAQLTGLNYGTLCKRYRGESDFTLRELIFVAAALHIPTAELIDG